MRRITFKIAAPQRKWVDEFLLFSLVKSSKMMALMN